MQNRSGHNNDTEIQKTVSKGNRNWDKDGNRGGEGDGRSEGDRDGEIETNAKSGMHKKQHWRTQFRRGKRQPKNRQRTEKKDAIPFGLASMAFV